MIEPIYLGHNLALSALCIEYQCFIKNTHGFTLIFGEFRAFFVPVLTIKSLGFPDYPRLNKDYFDALFITLDS